MTHSFGSVTSIVADTLALGSVRTIRYPLQTTGTHERITWHHAVLHNQVIMIMPNLNCINPPPQSISSADQRKNKGLGGNKFK